MKLWKKAGATSEIWQIFIADSSSTTGAGLTGLLFNTASLTAYYHRDTNTTATAIALVTMTVGTFTSSGFKEIDATNMPGWYQFCPPDAANAASAKSCAFLLKGATNMVPCPIEVQLTAVDPDDATAFGLSRLDAAITSRMATYTQPTGFLAATFPSGTVANTTNITAGTITTVTTVTNQLTAAQIATGVWQDATAGDFTVVSSIGKSLYTSGNAPGAASGLALVGSNMGTVSSVTGNVAGSVGSVTARVTANTDQINGTAQTARDLGLALPAAAPGAAGGVFIAGTNAPVTITGSGDALTLSSSAANGRGLVVSGNGTGSGATVTGGATGPGLKLVGGGTSGDGVDITTTSGDGVSILPTAGSAIVATGNGTSKFGVIATGGTGGTSDGVKAVAGTGGVPIRGDITGNIHGTLDTLTTYTGNTPQTGDAFARLGAPAGASTAADIAAVKTDTGNISTQVVSTRAEPSSVPAATSTLGTKVDWLFALARNKRTTTATVDTLRDDAEGATIGTSTISDDGTTFTRGKYV